MHGASISNLFNFQPYVGTRVVVFGYGFISTFISDIKNSQLVISFSFDNQVSLNIFINKCSCSDNGASTNLYSRQYGYPDTNPASIFNSDWSTESFSCTSISISYFMCSRFKYNIRCKITFFPIYTLSFP